MGSEWREVKTLSGACISGCGRGEKGRLANCRGGGTYLVPLRDVEAEYSYDPLTIHGGGFWLVWVC